MSLVYEKGALETREGVIVHSTATSERRPVGMARVIFERYPHTNTYTDKAKQRVIGRCDVFEPIAEDEPTVVNMNVRVRDHQDSVNDTMEMRLEAFRSCLRELDELATQNQWKTIHMAWSAVHWPLDEDTRAWRTSLEQFCEKTGINVNVVQPAVGLGIRTAFQ